LEREPRLLAAQVGQLQAQLEELSLRHYPTFLRTHHVLRDAQAQLGSVEVRMGSLASSVLPALEAACAHFQSNAPSIVAALAKQRSLASEQNFLLELLEVPALMDTAFKNNLVHEALQLDLFVKELVERQQQQAMTALATAETEAVANQTTASEKLITDADTAASAPPIPAILVLLQQVSPSTHSCLLCVLAAAALLRFRRETAETHRHPHLFLLLSAPRGVCMCSQQEMAAIKSNIVRSLLSQLRGPLDIESGFPIVGLLKRTLDIFAPSSATSPVAGLGSNNSILLKYQFLLARNAYFDNCLRALRPPSLPSPPLDGVPSPPEPFATMMAAAAAVNLGGAGAGGGIAAAAPLGSPVLHATLFAFLDELVSSTRRQLIDIVTLYAALFLDNDDAAAATPQPRGTAAEPALPVFPAESSSSSATSGSAALSDEERQQAADTALLCRWIHHRISLLLGTLRAYLPYLSDGSYLAKLLSALCSFSERLFRSREGLDFRPALVPLFADTVAQAFRRAMERAAQEFDTTLSLRNYAWRIPEPQLAKLGITALPQAKEHAAALAGFQAALLPFPPLKLLADALVSAVNELAKFAPLALAPQVASLTQKCLAQVALKLRHAQITQSGGSSSSSGNSTGGHADGSQSKSATSSSTAPSAATAASATTSGCTSADLLELARTYRDSCVPFVHALLGRVYPTAQGQCSYFQNQSRTKQATLQLRNAGRMQRDIRSERRAMSNS
jgi:hypothetical protein